MPLRKDEVVNIKKSELAEAVRESFNAPGCDVINSDVANDPEFEEMIRERLENVGNHAFGDISAQLERSPKASQSSLAMVRNFIRGTALDHS